MGRAVAGFLPGCALFVAAMGAGAATPVGSMNVGADVVAGCEIASSDFGNLDYGSFPTAGRGGITAALTSAVEIRCTPGLALSMQVDGGLHGRQLQRDGGSERIPYLLFSDAARNSPLAVGQPVSVPNSGTGVVVLPIHGELALSAEMPPGRYSDVLQVQLIW